MEDYFYAHSKENEPHEKWQTVKKHLQNVSDIAELFGKDFSSGKLPKIAGLFHDLGKYSKEFQNRIINQGQKVDHATAGAQFVYEKYGKQIGKLMSYAIAGHHSGLPNGNENEISDLKNRLSKKICVYENNIDFSIEKYDFNEKDSPFEKLKDKDIDGFELSFFIRMIFSCVVDADFLDTEKFMDEEKFLQRQGYLSVYELKEKLDNYLKQFSEPVEKINIVRNKVLNDCLDAAENDSGLFSLTVPTGGGKTFSSLAFALKHAIRNNQKRIIYVIPYTSIIEQNAEEMRKIFGEHAVLEHHSNIENESNLNTTAENRRAKLATENWDAPIIVTTNVQFFESLFSYRTSRCRKLHNIANSVIIFDEAQMFPVDFLQPCLRTISSLSKCYNSTIVLCTATQPALTKKTLKSGLEDVTEIISDPGMLYEDLKRVNVTLLDKDVTTDLLVEQLSKHKKVLCIVSTKKLALEIYNKMSELDNVYHLSSLMCPEHRSEIIKQIKDDLKNKSIKTCRVISTQLIEAGVDIDFPVVYRAIAGVDSIAQAAGRCNREGKLKFGKVNVFFPENGTPPGFLRKGAETAEIVLGHHEDILSLDSVEEYFTRLYLDSKTDKFEIIKELKSGDSTLDFPFRKIAEQFQLIRNDTITIIIPFDSEGEKRVDALRDSFAETRDLLRSLQRYSVQIHPYNFSKIESGIEIIKDRYFVLNNMNNYSNETGLNVETETNYSIDDLIQ